MFWTEEKLSRQIKELDDYRYRDKVAISSLQFQLDEKGEVGARIPEDGEWETVYIGERWQGRDVYAWLKTNVNVPAEWKGRQIIGRFDFGTTGRGFNSGFESLLYINGVPYQGVDSNHLEVFLPDHSFGSTLSLAFRLWSGLEGIDGDKRIQEHKFRLAEITWLDEATDDLFFTSKAVFESIQVLDDHQSEKLALLKALDRSFKAIDWSNTGSETFYQSVSEANELLSAEIEAIKVEHPVTVYGIGHTHIDVAWLWRLKHTREKSARSFSTVLRLMERYPEYTFLQTQPQLYDYMKTDYPEIYRQIKQRVEEGRWETDGGMWLEADCNIPSGESLVRQLLLGTTFFRSEFGTECKYLWLPDVFGYTWALPQILKKSGIETFMTTKISWNQYNRIPHDTFKWRGIDGTEILTHFITTPDRLGRYTYHGEVKAKTVNGIWKEYKDKSLNQELLLAYGFGDGGGGVNREMLEMRRRFDDIPGIPNVKTSRADEYFERLHETVKDTDQYVHTWDGELYLEYHRGTYTSQAYNKRMNRKLELLYRDAEWLEVLKGTLTNKTSAQYKLNEGWKMILRNQFHDIIPGSSIEEVYADSKVEYEEAENIGETVWSKSSQELTNDKEHTYTIFNSASWKQSQIVSISVISNHAAGTWLNCHGQEISSQKNQEGYDVYVEDVPALGYTTITYKLGQTGRSEKTEKVFMHHDSGVTSPFYRIQWNKYGQLTEIYDLQLERHVLSQGESGNVFQVFEDKPMNYDAWDIDLYYQEKMREVTALPNVEVMESGGLKAVIRFTWSYMSSGIEQEMVLYKDTKRIDFRTNVDWHEQEQLLKVAFPVNVRATEATYDIQFGNVKRPTHWNTSWDLARFETVGHQWADLSERTFGVSLLNDCKYGYDIKDHIMRLTLIKSALRPDPTQDQGEHLFTYSLYPHEGDWYEGKTVEEAWAMNNPLKYVQGERDTKELSLLKSSTNKIKIDAVKPSETDTRAVIRLHEYSGSNEYVELISDVKIKSWQECDLMERPSGEIINENIMKFKIAPYEIKTFLVEFATD
ncbi:alpha-mannosidase [Evansella halocellulosilytica]|uniref:alpha-mannosidase n=1 Tax=Evansella halocellulosilytica TaxID=2011013 RepID=UPI000BB7DD96|nr:alpha-mannosidase [Evansella halocellulosilytica]